MSSLDDVAVTPRHSDGVTTTPEDVLAAIKAEGGRRRTRRHRRFALVGVLALVVLAVPALALLPDDDDQVTVAADLETTTTEARKTTTSTTAASTSTTGTTATTVVVVETTPVAPVPAAVTPVPTTRRPSTPRTTAPPRTTVPPLVCRNSTDPACGAFRWDPSPGTNQALSASFIDPPASVVVGQDVTFSVGWSDPDADQISDAFSTEGTSIGAPCSVSQRYGPWTPPAARPGSGTRTFHHTFTSPGVHTVNVDLFTGNVCDHPYASERHIEMLIDVQPSG